MVKRAFWLRTSMQNNGSSSTDYAAALNDLPTTCIAGVFPERVRVNVVQKSKATPTSYSSSAFGNHRVTPPKQTIPFCKTINKTAIFVLSCFFPCFSLFLQIYIIVILFLIAISAVNTEFVCKTHHFSVVIRFIGRYSK